MRITHTLKRLELLTRPTLCMSGLITLKLKVFHQMLSWMQLRLLRVTRGTCMSSSLLLTISSTSGTHSTSKSISSQQCVPREVCQQPAPFKKYVMRATMKMPSLVKLLNSYHTSVRMREVASIQDSLLPLTNSLFGTLLLLNWTVKSLL